MLREQSGPENAGERYNAISSFLSATEDYLHRLAGKVASVRLAQEASEAAASAMSDARSQVELDVSLTPLTCAIYLIKDTSRTHWVLAFSMCCQSEGCLQAENI